uniref:Uncharacterized protein n=1 Tax=Anopheles atroparvus TaxID=41427 RepID=A0A182J550_ANOAO
MVAGGVLNDGGRQLPLAEVTPVHELHHQIGLLRVTHRHLGHPLRVPIVQQDAPDGATLAALLAQVALVLEQQVYLAIEQGRLEQILDDDDPLVLRALAAHLFRAPVEKSTQRGLRERKKKHRLPTNANS